MTIRPLPATLIMLLALPAQAGDAGFARMDRDGDGRITRPEAQALRAEAFAVLDADGSGGISAAELARQPALPGAGRLMRRDTNGDGRLTLAEFTAQSPGFDRADRNHDDALTPEEFGSHAALIASFLTLFP